MTLIRKWALYIAFLQVWIAVLGSLYFSEVLHLSPCLLCWYQRILMYPLAIILPVAIWRRDKNVAYYVLPLSILGLIVAFYHVLLQSALPRFALCDAYGSCSKIEFAWFGILTIPLMSVVAFGVITLMMAIVMQRKNNEK